jgi:hypothetical protein
MKKLIITMVAIAFSLSAWSDEHEVSGFESLIQVCEVNVGRKSIEGLEMCKKGDHLLLFYSRTTKRPYRNRVIASTCVLGTITILETESSVNSIGPYVVVCEFNGESLLINNKGLWS